MDLKDNKYLNYVRQEQIIDIYIKIRQIEWFDISIFLNHMDHRGNIVKCLVFQKHRDV